MENCYLYSFHIQKITNQGPFMQFSVLMEVNEKCMIRIFPYMKIV